MSGIDYRDTIPAAAAEKCPQYVDPTTPAFGNLSPLDLHRAPAFGEYPWLLSLFGR